MKIRNIILAIALAIMALSSCLKDEGNYEYFSLNEPIFDYPRYYSEVLGYGGDSIIHEGLFHYPQADSLELLANTEYEWHLNGHAIARTKDLKELTDSVMSRAKLDAYPKSKIPGVFMVKNKVSGATYLHQVNFYLRPKFWKGSYLVLSKDGSNSKLSYLRMTKVYDDEGYHFEFEQYDDMYGQQNEGQIIPGSPRKIIDHTAPDVSTSVGATTILTDQVAWEINNEKFTFHRDVRANFVDGTPEGLDIKDVFYRLRKAFIVNTDGKIYVKTYSQNYLGGSFINEPYPIDAKIEFIASSQLSPKIKYMYDSKNNRLVAINRDLNITTIDNSNSNVLVNITNLGDNVEVLAVAGKTYSPLGNISSSYDPGVMLYRESGELWVSEFVTRPDSEPYLTTQKARKYPFTGQLQSDSKIWMSGMYKAYMTQEQKYAIFYTANNQIRYFNRETQADNLLMEFDHKVTAVQLHTYAGSMKNKFMGVGLANGDFFIVDLREDTPQIMPESKFNVGGEVADISVVGGCDLD